MTHLPFNGDREDPPRPATPGDDAPAMTPGRGIARLWMLSFAAWSIPALLEATQSFAGLLQSGAGTTWLENWLRFAPKYYMWALLTPVVWWVARRVPLNRPGQRLRALLIHALTAIVLSVIHLFFAAVYYFAFWNSQGETLSEVLTWYFASVFGFELLVYPIVTGAYHLIHYQRLVREQQLAAARLETSLAVARFDALQRRLHPHFLFNALNAFVGMLRYDRNAEVIRAIGELGHLLRDALDESRGQERPLEEELEWAERYLAIEQLRIGPRLNIAIDVDADVLEVPVPRLLLQPLLENAIHHGIAPSPTAGHVTIEAGRQGDSLRIRVLDDGAGPAPDRSTRGLGLDNTLERLRHLHGPDRTGLTLSHREGGGACATVILPIRARPAEAPAGPLSEPGLQPTA